MESIYKDDLERINTFLGRIEMESNQLARYILRHLCTLATNLHHPEIKTRLIIILITKFNKN